MNSSPTRILCLAMLVAVAPVFIVNAGADEAAEAPPSVADLQAEIDALKLENKKLSERFDEVLKRYENARERFDQVTGQKQALELQLAELREELQKSKQGGDTKAGTKDPSTTADPAPKTAEVEQLERELEQAKAKVTLLETEKQELEKIAGVSSKGELIASEAARIVPRFDEKYNQTLVLTKPLPVIRSNIAGFHKYEFGAGFSFEGRELKQEPEEFTLVLYTVANQNQRFRRFKNATLVVDGKEMTAPVSEYEVLSSATGVRTSRGGSSNIDARNERITIGMDPELAARVAAASSLEVRFPKIQFELGRDHIAMVGGVIRRVELMLNPIETPKPE